MCSDSYSIFDLLSIMERLRSPNGCPWDREQNHQSIRNNFLEEVYEVLEAIDNQSDEQLQEELGDVLLQVVFHAQIAKEIGSFTFDDVCNDICVKLIQRHPHVFGSRQVKNSREVLQNWEEIKNKTKRQDTVAATLHSVPRVFPALMRAQKIQHRAGKGGFTYNSTDDALKDLHSELSELEDALSRQDRENVREEIGDLLFSVVNVCRMAGFNAEECLSRSTDKFQSRVCSAEELAAADGKRTSELSSQELERLWKLAKSAQ